MNETKRRNEVMRFLSKLIIGLIALSMIYVMQHITLSQLSYSSTLFQSAMFSLLMLLFWVGAGWILRKPTRSQQMNYD